MAKCSFGKFSIKGTFTPIWPYHTDLYARLFYIESESSRMLLCAFDSLGTFARDAERFKDAVSEQCGIPKNAIIFHELQVHAAPDTHQMAVAMDEIIARAVPAVNALIQSAVPFSCRAVKCNFGGKHSFCREQYVEGLGGVTVWTGMRYDEEGTPCIQDPGKMLLLDYRPDLPVLKKPVPFDNQNDPMAYLFVFCNESGDVIGSISRFAAHPDVAVLFEHRPLENKHTMYHYDFDWPGYLSEELERVLGGCSMYINGPCGDLTSRKGYEGVDGFEDSDAECKRIGLAIADDLLSDFERNSVPVDCDNLKVDTFRINIPLREDMPRSRNEAGEQDEKIEAALRNFEKAKSAPSSTPAEVKRTIDDLYKARYTRHIVFDSCGFDDETLANRTVSIDIPCFRLGEFCFIGLPGESLCETTVRLRSMLAGSNTVTVDQCNGYFGYMATPRTLTLGGYTYWCSWTDRKSVPALEQKVYDIATEFFK